MSEGVKICLKKQNKILKKGLMCFDKRQPPGFPAELARLSSRPSGSPSSGIPVRSDARLRKRPSGFLSEAERFLRIWFMMTSRGERLWPPTSRPRWPSDQWEAEKKNLISQNVIFTVYKNITLSQNTLNVLKFKISLLQMIQLLKWGLIHG